MQTFIESILDQYQRSQTWYHLNYLGSNNIGDEGCRYLSKTEWNNLHRLDLCIIYNMKPRILSELKDADISQRHSGPISIISILVSNCNI